MGERLPLDAGPDSRERAHHPARHNRKGRRCGRPFRYWWKEALIQASSYSSSVCTGPLS